ncbi:peptidoglycan DD-metalloendopeptidase family protein [Algoriphagus lutimaris]|uniref:peptidoglycan DD-metalloendopeptidase family protein n=1 Tax=Algoriphagus lutimaris TaxID=613197 RepID=UPI00196B6826|nr:peptidoglycan DD-metalloendopeptidase family protein [Algoriphagus lutimaris]MBN3520830.1 peptidoglycan DD-metalloendopeptidase family protein [Algoriphagus lutimaris]
MNWKKLDFYPVMGEALTEGNTLKMDFSPANSELTSVNLGNTQKFNDFVFDQLSNQNKKFGIGGYFEHRAIYQRSEVFVTQELDFRNIHLGVDIWAEAGTPVFAPFEGEVYSLQDNQGFGNYGGTIILQHEIGGESLYSLYGHLKRSDLTLWKVGDQVKFGDLLCHIGPFPENGDWPPHLHFQLMLDMLGNYGDFPGVCSQREMEKFRAICPDPNLMIRCPMI